MKDDFALNMIVSLSLGELTRQTQDLRSKKRAGTASIIDLFQLADLEFTLDSIAQGEQYPRLRGMA